MAGSGKEMLKGVGGSDQCVPREAGRQEGAWPLGKPVYLEQKEGGESRGDEAGEVAQPGMEWEGLGD